MITIHAIGKKHEDWVKPGIERYGKRLRAPFTIDWVLLPHSSLENDAARREETQRLLGKLPNNATVILLDERGKQFSSIELTDQFNQWFTDAKPLCIVIGGAYGIDDALYKRANLVWSLSKLVLPHQLVRLVLVEQIYRAQQISAGSKYHHL